PCPCGRSGHLEGLASGPGIVRLAARLGARDQHGRTPADGHALARAAAAGDDAAAEAYRIAGFATGRVVGGVLNVLDAEVVALTGGVTEAESPWRTALDAGLAHDAMDGVAEAPVPPAPARRHARPAGAGRRGRAPDAAGPGRQPCRPARRRRPGPGSLCHLTAPDHRTAHPSGRTLMHPLLAPLEGTLIVSCQAYPGEPMRDPGTM